MNGLGAGMQLIMGSVLAKCNFRLDRHIFIYFVFSKKGNTRIKRRLKFPGKKILFSHKGSSDHADVSLNAYGNLGNSLFIKGDQQNKKANLFKSKAHVKCNGLGGLMILTINLKFTCVNPLEKTGSS